MLGMQEVFEWRGASPSEGLHTQSCAALKCRRVSFCCCGSCFSPYFFFCFLVFFFSLLVCERSLNWTRTFIHLFVLKKSQRLKQKQRQKLLTACRMWRILQNDVVRMRTFNAPFFFFLFFLYMTPCSKCWRLTCANNSLFIHVHMQVIQSGYLFLLMLSRLYCSTWRFVKNCRSFDGKLKRRALDQSVKWGTLINTREHDCCLVPVSDARNSFFFLCVCVFSLLTLLYNLRVVRDPERWNQDTTFVSLFFFPQYYSLVLFLFFLKHGFILIYQFWKRA